MDESEIKRVIVLPIVLLLAAGIAWAGSQHGLRFGNVPIFSIAVIISFLVNWIAFIPAKLNETEKYYDLTGGITYLSVVWISMLLIGPSNWTTRGLVLAIIVTIWSLRLSTFLFRRIQKSGGDSRFDEIKKSTIRFLSAWTIQGLWVIITASAALAAMTSDSTGDLGIIGWLGVIVWILGMSIEVIADRQKSQFKADPTNEGKFISSGLWAWSRHPNYFGEIVLWIGVTIAALPALKGAQFVTLISPLFVIFLLMKVSGVPLLEEKADKRWGGQDDYEEYKSNTPVLIPKPPAA